MELFLNCLEAYCSRFVVNKYALFQHCTSLNASESSKGAEIGQNLKKYAEKFLQKICVL